MSAAFSTQVSEPNFSRHTVADVRDWQKLKRLEIQPDFQRRAVWPDAAKIMLIDSILNKYPVPKIFVGTYIKDGSTRRVVVDGQQRITAILEFLDGKFSLGKPYAGPYQRLRFDELPEEVQNAFLSYNLDFNEFQNWSDEQIREVYNRVNKYSFSLTKQELRRAEFPGEFLRLSEDLSVHPFFDDARIFSPANRRRLADVEYTSELLVVLLAGIQDKKETLDDYYLEYQVWPNSGVYKERFCRTIEQIELVFDAEALPIARTRFRQKADFYSLFAALSEIVGEEREIRKDKLTSLRHEFRGLDALIEPSAPHLYGEYAVRCVSDANSSSSRRWRTDFLRKFLLSAYNTSREEQDEIGKFLLSFVGVYDSGMCPPLESICPVCKGEATEYAEDVVWVIPRESLFLEEALIAHTKCIEGNPDYVVREEG